MAVEYNATVTYTAGELTYSFPFLYLKKEFVKAVYVAEDGTETELTYNQDYSIEGQILTLNEAGSSDDTIRIYRQTPTDSIVEFVDASILKAYDLNTIEIQLLHISEENHDYGILHNMTLDTEDSAWQAGGHRIKNVADPTNENDVLTLHYWTTILDPDWSTRIATAVANAASSIATTIYNHVQGLIDSATTTLNELISTSTTTINAAVSAAETSATNAAESEATVHSDAMAAAASAEAAFVSEANAQTLVNTVNPPWNVRLNSTDYAVGYIACSANLPSNIRLECITAGTTGTSEPTGFPDAISGNTVTDGTVVWLYTDVRGILPHLTITAPTGCTITATQDSTVLTAIEEGTTGVWQFNLPRLGDWVITCSKTVDGVARAANKTVHVREVKDYSIQTSYGYRYGYRISKTEGSPSARVEYLYDAVGLQPASMNFTTGVFDYGDWGDKWFVTDNKPLMLKSNGTVDYYLYPNDYTKKEDGTTDSDVSNTSYDGNAMAQFPLVWVYRYEDDDYCYEIISDVQFDENYKAYAHTRMDGSIADYFYWSLFGGSGSASKIRSLAGQTLAASLTAANEIAGATANGSVWYTHTWAQHELIRTLCVLLGKSTDVQSVFGYGNCRSGSQGSVLASGTLKTMGQFFGYSNSSSQVKVFHVEKFWGDQWDRLAGFISNGYKAYVKMTREDAGYRITDTNGYTDTGITIASMSSSYISGCSCTEYGMIPTAASGSASTYYCDAGWSASGMTYLIVGAAANDASSVGGAFCFNSSVAASYAAWFNGCGLSAEQPAEA